MRQDFSEYFLRGKMRITVNGPKQNSYSVRTRMTSTRTAASLPRTNFYASAVSSGYSRNQNSVKYKSNVFGRFSSALLITIMVAILGLFYVSEQSQTTAFDYKINEVNTQLSDLEAERDDLRVEQARLQSIANSKNSTVASNMETATAAGFTR